MQLRIPRTPSRLRFTAAAAFAMFLFGCSQNPQTQTQPASLTSKESETERSTSTANTVTAKPDEKSDSKALAAKVYMPPKAIGHVKMAYMAAKQIPEILQQLFCYCGCDQMDEHTSLFDCYKDVHSVDCNYCKGEAIMALKMNKNGCTIAEIQKAVDLNWGPHYPFPEDFSGTIKNYWKTRIWAPGDAPTQAEKHEDDKPLFDPFKQTLEKYNMGAGLQSGSCCGGSKDMKTAKTTKQ